MNKENKFYVYVHTFPNGVLYVGKGSGNRAYTFVKSSRRNCWWNGLQRKFGNPKVSFIAEHLCEELSYLLEMEVIDLYKKSSYTLCNMTAGGDGILGMSEETLKKKRFNQRKVTCKAVVVNDKYLFDSVSDCATAIHPQVRDLTYSALRSGISSVISGKQKSVAGLRFEYYIPEKHISVVLFENQKLDRKDNSFTSPVILNESTFFFSCNACASFLDVDSESLRLRVVNNSGNVLAGSNLVRKATNKEIEKYISSKTLQFAPAPDNLDEMISDVKSQQFEIRREKCNKYHLYNLSSNTVVFGTLFDIADIAKCKTTDLRKLFCKNPRKTSKGYRLATDEEIKEYERKHS